MGGQRCLRRFIIRVLGDRIADCRLQIDWLQKLTDVDKNSVWDVFSKLGFSFH